MSTPQQHSPDGAPAAAPSAEGAGRELRFTGRTGELFAIFLGNLLLTLVTLTLYRFWARTRVRSYLWSQMQLLDEPFEYTGSGLELFLGFIVILFLVILPMTLGYIALDLFVVAGDPQRQSLLAVLLYPGILFLVGVAVYRARRYRLSRTLWRGIRLGQSGSSLAYGVRYALYVILSVLTLGWFVPAKNLRLWSRLIDNSRFGSERFRFEPAGMRLYPRFAASWLLSIPTLGLSFAWYKAAELRVFAAATRIQDLRFELEVSGFRLLRFALANGMLLVLTLGLAVPFVQIRKARFIARHLRLVGEPNLALVEQSPELVPGVGEGLAEAFDLGQV